MEYIKVRPKPCLKSQSFNLTAPPPPPLPLPLLPPPQADNCASPGGNSSVYFAQYSAAINASATAAGRAVAFGLCQWGLDSVSSWGPSMGQLYRINPDHLPFWRFDAPNSYPPGGQGTADLIDKWADPATGRGLAPFSWPDPDFLETGLFQTEAEGQTEFTFWALWGAPLVVTTELRNLSAWKRSVLLNEDALAVQADPLLAPAARLRADNATGAQLWARPLSGGRIAAVLYNGADLQARDVACTWAELGWAGASVDVYDAWAHSRVGAGVQGGATAKALPPHGSAMWILSKAA